MSSVEPPGVQPPRGEQRIPARKSHLGALAYRDFRLLCSGMFISALGYWMQFTSLTYLVGIVLADSASQGALNLAMLGAARSIPAIIGSPIAGYVADRYPRKTTLFITNATQAIAALLLAIVAHTKSPYTLLLTLLLAGLTATAQSFDNPARQSWVAFLVPRNLLSNAIGLTALSSNAPLMIGPAVAGILIASVGIYVSFFTQAMTQWLVVLAIVLMRPAPPNKITSGTMFGQITEGVKFVFAHPTLRWVVGLLLVGSLCLRPYSWLLATFAGHVLNVDAKAYGLMLTIGGIGTIIGALTTTLSHSEKRARMWALSAVITGLGLVALCYVREFPVVLVILAVMGWGVMTFQSISQVMIQTLAPEDMRGRAMSLYAMLMIGFTPLGTMIFGSVGSQIGLSYAYLSAGGIAIIATIWVWISHPALRKI